MPRKLSAVVAGLTVAIGILLVVPGDGSAHKERPSYFPDPGKDRSISPPAGGEVPKPKTLVSALKHERRGISDLLVVCKPDSMKRLRRSIRQARRNGYENRPTDQRRFGKRKAKNLKRTNRKLHRRCDYRHIQKAVFDARNNDRIVVMPGLYREGYSRRQPTFDPRCDEFETQSDFPREPGALSYEYQFRCPNDQNLVAVMGRRPGKGEDPDPPRFNRHGIPNTGRCIRCNLQIEGSGVSADDVIVEAGDASAGNGGPSGVGAKKDVAIRADRADGFVLKKVTVRHAGEHGIYVIETDGYTLTKFKAYYSRLYGTLTFANDHGRQQHCDTVGHGDSGIYPGGAPETGVQRPPGTLQRLNQEIRKCDMHHNLAGYSGTNGNAVHVHDNEIYDNALGIQTDVVTGAGHPGYPGDSMLVEFNNIYSNNFNPYDPDSDVPAAFPFPVGTGMWIAGGNHHEIRKNHVYDNWRRGFMLFAVPDDLICGPQTGNQQAGCEPGETSTSHYNSYHDNFMGVRPDGTADPNGTDFWWDSFPGNRGNCWFRNVGPAPITTSPPTGLPGCDDGKDPATSVGTGDAANQGELVACFVAFETDNFDPSSGCPWFTTPPEPQPTKASARERRQAQRAERARMRDILADFCGSEEGAGTAACLSLGSNGK